MKDIPTFDGNPLLLYDFINNVEKILELMPHIKASSFDKTILRAIRNKIIGQANEILNIYGTLLEWEEIKSNLLIHYSNKRNETSLIRDLHIRQDKDDVETFYTKILEILSTMINHVRVHESDVNVINSKKKPYKGSAI